jgi:hypothetical protein
MIEHVFANIKAWQANQFGPVSKRGPLGPLRHLQKEAREAEGLVDSVVCPKCSVSEPRSLCAVNRCDHPWHDPDVGTKRAFLYEEIADCQFMVWEAAWRSGMSVEDLAAHLERKLEKNKSREWPLASDSEPVEHVRSQWESFVVNGRTNALLAAFFLGVGVASLLLSTALMLLR